MDETRKKVMNEREIDNKFFNEYNKHYVNALTILNDMAKLELELGKEIEELNNVMKPKQTDTEYIKYAKDIYLNDKKQKFVIGDSIWKKYYKCLPDEGINFYLPSGYYKDHLYHSNGMKKTQEELDEISRKHAMFMSKITFF